MKTNLEPASRPTRAPRPHDELDRVTARAIGGVTNRVAYDVLSWVTTNVNALEMFTHTCVNATARLSGMTYLKGQTTLSYSGNTNDQRLQTISSKNTRRTHATAPDHGTPISRYRDGKTANPSAVGLLFKGDSWFAYSVPISTNLPTELKKLNREKMVGLDFSKSGDDAREMLSGRQHDKLFNALAGEKLAFDGILFSGGGDDIVAANLPLLLNTCKPGYTWEDCLNMERCKRRLREIYVFHPCSIRG